MKMRLKHCQSNSSSPLLNGWVQWLLLLTSLCCVHADQVVFTEIMYHPRHDKDSAWVELVNLTSTPQDCAEWRLEGKSLEYSFPMFDPAKPRESFIRPSERFLITEWAPNDFRELYQIPSHVRIWGPWKGKFDLGTEKLVLKDKNGIGLCSVDFKNDPPWPIEAAGAGYSLGIRHTDRTVNHWSNWMTSSKWGGTPGSAPFPKNGLQFQLKPSESEFHR